MIIALAAAVLLSSSASSSMQDGPIVTAAPRGGETADALRYREAVAYANPIPRGAPEADYPLVAWCEALVNGHVALGESLETSDALDAEIVRLGKLEATDFHTALEVGASRQTPATLAAARTAAADASSKWAVFADAPADARSQAFGLFMGLPGRCEHAARRVRDNITTPPATPAEVGIVEEPAA